MFLSSFCRSGLLRVSYFRPTCLQAHVPPPARLATRRLLATTEALKAIRLNSHSVSLTQQHEELNKAIDDFLQTKQESKGESHERNTRLFLSQLHRHFKQVDPDKLKAVLEHIKEGNFHKQRTYNQAIVLFGKLGDLPSALQLFEKMEVENVPPNTTVYNTIFHLLSKAHPDKAMLLFKEMKSKGIELNEVTYCILFSVLKEIGTFGEVRLHQQELVIRGIPGNLMLYNNLIDTYAKLHRMENAIQVYHEMKSKKIEPNAITYTILIDGYGKNGQVAKACKYYKEMLQNGMLPTAKTYNVLIQLYTSRNDIRQAIGYYEEMIKRGLKPTQFTYEILLTSCLRSKKHDLVDKMCRALGSSDYVGSTVVYNSLLNYHKSHSNSATILQCFEEMKDKGVFPDVVTYNTLLNFGAEKETSEWLDSKYKEMISLNISPNIITYNTLLKGFVRNKEFEKAWELFPFMMQHGVHPDVVSYNIIINGYSKQGQMEQAEETVKKMESANLMPSVTTYNSLIQGYANSGNVEKALKIYQQLLNDPFASPDRITNQLKRKYLVRKQGLSVKANVSLFTK